MPRTYEVKPCTLCGVEKPLDEFHRNRGSKDGRASACKPCNRERSRKWKVDNPERVSEHNHRYWQNLSVERRNELTRRARESHPEKWLARAAVNNAVAEGRLTKPTRCEGCEKDIPSRSLHAHHEDYGKRLEVEWLCVRCHSARHKREKAALQTFEESSK